MSDIQPVIGGARWFWDCGLVEPNTQQTLLLYGYMVNDCVKDVQLVIDTEAEPMGLTYRIFLPRVAEWRYRLYRAVMDRLRDSKSIPGKLLRNLIMKRYGIGKMMDIDFFIRKSVAAFLGERVPVKIEVLRWEN